jgi:hypothetical protein
VCIYGGIHDLVYVFMFCGVWRCIINRDIGFSVITTTYLEEYSELFVFVLSGARIHLTGSPDCVMFRFEEACLPVIVILFRVGL